MNQINQRTQPVKTFPLDYWFVSKSALGHSNRKRLNEKHLNLYYHIIMEHKNIYSLFHNIYDRKLITRLHE